MRRRLFAALPFRVAGLAMIAACSHSDAAPALDRTAPGVDAGMYRAPVSPVASATDASAATTAPPQTTTDAAPLLDAAAGLDASTSPALTIYPRTGDPNDDATTPAGPGLVLDGGTMVAAAITWARATLGADVTRRAFDAVIVAAAGGDQSAFLYNGAMFRSAQTLVVGAGATAADFAAAAAIVARAELVFLPGGEQSGYAVWKGSALATAMQGVYDRGGVACGTSAGSLILGAFAFDALDAGGISENVTPALALANPYDPQISFTRHMFTFAPLADAITEVHFETLDRMGRLSMFLARQQADGVIVRTPPVVLGVAVDEHAAVVIDAHGSGKLLRDDPSGRAFLVKGGPPTICTPGARLVYSALEVHRLDDPSQSFDFVRWCGTAPVYTLDVSADASAPFGVGSPYDRDASASSCP